jgi:hypothetical protein
VLSSHVQFGQLDKGPLRSSRNTLRVYAIIDGLSSPVHPLGEAVEVFIRREDAERFIEEVRGDDPELAESLRIEERELEAGGLGNVSPSG